MARQIISGGIGIAAGAAFGAILGNVAVGIGLGIIAAVAIGLDEE